MESTLVIGLIVTLLVVGVAISGYFQVREKAKAELRQKTNQCLYRVRQAQDFLDRFANFPIGKATKTTLLKYSLYNLQEIEKLDPGRNDISKRINAINQRLDNLDSEGEPGDSQIPQQSEQIVALMSNYKKLMIYIQKLGKLPAMNTHKAKESISFLKGYHRHLQVLTYISVGKQAISENKMVLARQYLDNAKKILLSQGIADEQNQALLEELQELEDLTGQANAPQEDAHELEDAMDESEEEENNDLFRKKKW